MTKNRESKWRKAFVAVVALYEESKREGVPFLNLLLGGLEGNPPSVEDMRRRAAAGGSRGGFDSPPSPFQGATYNIPAEAVEWFVRREPLIFRAVEIDGRAHAHPKKWKYGWGPATHVSAPCGIELHEAIFLAPRGTCEVCVKFVKDAGYVTTDKITYEVSK